MSNLRLLYGAVVRGCVRTDEDVSEDCFVIALEIMDNMPHDKIVRKSKPSTVSADASKKDEPWWAFSSENSDEWFETRVKFGSEDGSEVNPLVDCFFCILYVVAIHLHTAN